MRALSSSSCYTGNDLQNPQAPAHVGVGREQPRCRQQWPLQRKLRPCPVRELQPSEEQHGPSSSLYSGQGEQVLQGSQWMDCSKKHRRRRCGPALTLAVAAEPRRGDRLACPCLCLCPRPCLLPGVSCRPFASCLGPLAQSRPPAASQAHHQLHRHYPRRHQAPPSALECSPYWLPRHPRADCGKPPFRELIKTRGRASETLPLVNR